MYKYETHVHSLDGSACGNSKARDIVNAYRNAGYAGLVLTNHFIHGNTNVPRNLDWNTRMQMYYDAYLNAKAEGDKYDFDVLFGLEHAYGEGKEVLTYGIDLKFLQLHPELEHVDIETYADIVHEAGGVIVHAHPHRVRDYITPNVKPCYHVCDGIEVYNAADDAKTNELARMDAKHLDKFMTSGGDVHGVNDHKIKLAGMVFRHRIKTNQEFIEALRNRDGQLLIEGRVETK